MANSSRLTATGSGSPNSLPGLIPGPIQPQSAQSITIQLTKALSEEHWEEVEESDLIFALDQDDEEAPAAKSVLCKAALPIYVPPAGSEGTVVDELALAAYECAGDVLLAGETQRCHSPVLPSSPTSKPLINLVKSVSTEIDTKDPSALKPHPFVNLVKSISTEISRLEPEVSQSKSDSKLNVHLWRQITQPKSKNGDSRTAPSSPSMSPSESKGMFFNVQEVEAKLEDTRRRLSEAMQEPLNMLSKIIGEETSPSPKCRTLSPLFSSQESLPSQMRDQGVLEARNSFPSLEEGEALDFEEHSRTLYRESPKPFCQYKICSYGDVIEVVELANDIVGADEVLSQPTSPCQTPHMDSDVPCSALLCGAILTYNFFIWPLPAYISGLVMGIASGFLLGLFMVLLFVPKPSYSSRHKRSLMEQSKVSLAPPKVQEPCSLQGWMNEMFSYDPELYHPALTHSVFVTLEGTTLTRCYPKSNLPRRSTFGEEIPEVVFVNSEVNILTNAQVFLTPPGLAKKRIWNKKYPICIVLSDGEDSESPDQEPGDPDGEEYPEKCEEAASERTSRDATGRTLYLFGRTGRDKEQWYQNLAKAAMAGRLEATGSDSRLGSAAANQQSGPGSGGGTSNSSLESAEEGSHLQKPRDLPGNIKQKILLDYNSYISCFIPPESRSHTPSPHHSAASSPTPRRKLLAERSLSTGPSVFWVNAFIGRILWDFLREKYWEDIVANKIQKKLTKIKLPNFMNELTLTELDMGTSLPQILSTSNPSVNERGLWMDMEVTYSGSLQVTLETKMNLSKLGKDSAGEEAGVPERRREGTQKSRVRIITDSEEESSSAGSSEDEEIPTAAETPGDRGSPNNPEGFGGGSSTSRKILRFVDKIAKSRYFQKATENEYIKRKMEEVSNTPLLLTVEIQELEGTLTINIPPPPTDRIWYSFRSPPRVEMKVVPKLGDREVTFIHVTEWIEKKLQEEFQKILVMPNMDDLYFPVMQSAVDNSQEVPPPDPSQPGAP